MTYLGFASGDIDQDAFGVRKMVDDGNTLAFCQSFSKNAGLYGETMILFLIFIKDLDL